MKLDLNKNKLQAPLTENKAAPTPKCNAEMEAQKIMYPGSFIPATGRKVFNFPYKSNKTLTAAVLFFVMLFNTFPCISEEKKIDRTPEPYGVEEFKTWQKDLRRFEIISFGAMPFVSLLTFWAYDMIRYMKHQGNPAYYPWPFKKADKAEPLTEDEQKKIFYSIIGISIGVGLIDFSYRAIKREIQRKKLEAENINSTEPIELLEYDENTLTEKEEAANTSSANEVKETENEKTVP